MAVDDVVTAEPGARVSVYPASNDLVGVGDQVTVAPLEQTNSVTPDSVSLDQESGLLSAVAPGVGAASVSVGYALIGSAGVGPAGAVSVRSQVGYLNPPRVYDHLAAASGSVGVAEVLDDAWDVDGEASDLRLVEVTGSGVVFDPSGRVEAALMERVRSVVFVVEDGSGARSAAVLFVPAAGVGGLGLVSSGEILVDRDSSVTVDVNDYVESPRGTTVRVTSRSAAEAAPLSGLTVEAVSSTQLQVTALNGYVGPGSITLELMDSEDSSDPDIVSGWVTIPVQVGPVVPVLRCPAEPVEVVQGGRPVLLDVASLCHVWMPDPSQVGSLLFSAVLASPLNGVSVSSGEHVLSVRAAGVARPGSSERIVLGVVGFEAAPADLVVTVVEAPPPSLVVSTLTDVAQGTVVSHRVQVVSPLVDARPALVSARQLSGMACGLEWSGTSLVLSPGVDSFGPMVFEVVATDLGSEPARAERHVSGVFTMVVYGRPEAPSAPAAGPVVSHGVGLTWSSGADHGAAVEEFELVEVGSGRSWSVGRATRFDVVGLPNGVEACFQVRARNRAGWSDFSPVGGCQVPDEVPGRSARFEVVGVGDGTVALEWAPAPVDGTPVTAYHLAWPGGSVQLPADQRSFEVVGLDNYTIYDFALTAENRMGRSHLTATTSGQSSGRPVCHGGLTIQPDDLADQARVNLSWSAADANGPGPVTYRVVRAGRGEAGSGALDALHWTDQVVYDGTAYHYTLQASNATGGPAHTCTLEGDFSAVGVPAAWGANSLTVVPTGQDGQAKLIMEVPPARGASSNLTLIGWPGVHLTSPGPDGGHIEVIVDGLPNGLPTAIQVQLCNENGNPCQNSPTRSVTVFGQLTTPQVSARLHGSYGDHQLCASASASAHGATATLSLRASKGSTVVSQTSQTGIDGLAITDWCVDAGAEETTLNFVATLSSGPTNPTRPDPASAQASATTLKDPKPPLLQPTLTTRQGGVGDHVVCATAHGDGRGYPASLYVVNSYDNNRTATVSGNNGLNTSELCVNPGTPGQAVTFTAYLTTGVTDPPRDDAPAGQVTLVSSALPLLTPDVPVWARGGTPDYGVCASASGDGRGTPAKLYLTSSIGGQSAVATGSNVIQTGTWCVDATPGATVVFTAHLEDNSTTTPRPAVTNTGAVTAPPPPPAFAAPALTVRQHGGTGDQQVCASASGQAGGFGATLTITNNRTSASWGSGTGTGALSVAEHCVSAGFGVTVTFTATLHSTVSPRADAIRSASVTAPNDYHPSVSIKLRSTSSGLCTDNNPCYPLLVTTSGFPGTVNCTLVQNNVGHSQRTWTQGANETNHNAGFSFGRINTKAEVSCTSGSYTATSGYVNLS
ncbi:MAG: fibronectin type III domain-containing protein [Propionibacteriaceae bacterium]|nr:fibronectin type III domain-containing protein [Propionibacteriaceae bacterium]